MARSFSTLKDIYDHGFDTVIDTRSPAEFAEDHVPGAINLPALSNDERAEVGTMYKQQSPFLARKLGAALVLSNIAVHLRGPLKDQDGGWQPLVYCWRGGQRSGVFTTLLQEIGWRAEQLNGGYQSYRRLVNAALYDDPLPHKFVLLDGYTGTAKTALLPRLDEAGVQTIDLEGLAGHRGSLLGAMSGGQPSQRSFETQLALALTSADPTRPLIVEAESSKIGHINLPPSLWAAMLAAPRITVEASVEARVAYLTEAYEDILRDPSTVKDRLAPLRRLRGHAVVDRWQTLQDDCDFAGLARALINDHYDPAYAKSRDGKETKTLGTVHIETLDHTGLQAAAQDIAKRVSAD